MPSPEVLTESSSKTVTLSSVEASRLAQLGRRLASSKAWWGSSEDDDGDRTIIRVRPQGGDQWEVRVSDAVGAISVGTAEFIVQPKIPQSHLLYLLDRSGLLPRLDPQQVALSAGASLWELVARWYVEAVERLLRRDLIKDYRSTLEVLPVIRGRTVALATARSLLKGRVEITCEFDEFDADNALN